MPLDCHNHDTGEDYQRTFIGGKLFPPTAVPRSGRLRLRWVETDAGRRGNIVARLDWRGRAYPLLASFNIIVPQVPPGLEFCLGEIDVPSRWTRAHVPSTP